MRTASLYSYLIIYLFFQDYPERPSTTEATSRREHRRRHYYAKEDSEEDEPH